MDDERDLRDDAGLGNWRRRPSTSRQPSKQRVPQTASSAQESSTGSNATAQSNPQSGDATPVGSGRRSPVEGGPTGGQQQQPFAQPPPPPLRTNVGGSVRFAATPASVSAFGGPRSPIDPSSSRPTTSVDSAFGPGATTSSSQQGAAASSGFPSYIMPHAQQPGAAAAFPNQQQQQQQQQQPQSMWLPSVDYNSLTPEQQQVLLRAHQQVAMMAMSQQAARQPTPATRADQGASSSSVSHPSGIFGQQPLGVSSAAPQSSSQTDPSSSFRAFNQPGALGQALQILAGSASTPAGHVQPPFPAPSALSDPHEYSTYQWATALAAARGLPYPAPPPSSSAAYHHSNSSANHPSSLLHHLQTTSLTPSTDPTTSAAAHSAATTASFASPFQHSSAAGTYVNNPTLDGIGQWSSSGASSNPPSPEGSDIDIEDEDTETPVTEDKRRRNTAASARFRVKKKQRLLELERAINDLEGKAEELEKEADELRKENGWLKEMVILKGRRVLASGGVGVSPAMLSAAAAGGVAGPGWPPHLSNIGASTSSAPAPPLMMNPSHYMPGQSLAGPVFPPLYPDTFGAGSNALGAGAPVPSRPSATDAYHAYRNPADTQQGDESDNEESSPASEPASQRTRRKKASGAGASRKS